MFPSISLNFATSKMFKIEDKYYDGTIWSTNLNYRFLCRLLLLDLTEICLVGPDMKHVDGRRGI
jgi:hypothetical protein